MNKKISNCKMLIHDYTFKENYSDFRNSKTIDIMKKLNKTISFINFLARVIQMV